MRPSVLAVVTIVLARATPGIALWPQPTSLQTGSSTLLLAPNFNIKVSIPHAPSDLTDAVTRTKQYLQNDKLERLVVGRGAADVSALTKAKSLSSLTLQLNPGATVRSITAEAQVALEDRDEAYALTVPSDGSGAVISANSTLGLFRGLTTFGQLWYYSGGIVYAINQPTQIKDAPAYPYRGFMLDTARNFFSVSDIQRTLDAMSWVKINTFHWHVVDSQSFPLEVPGYTDLAQKGAYSASSVYSPSDVASIVSYAGARGIDVLVEIDTPGHTSAIAAAHPEHIACADATPWSDFANEPPAGQLRLASPATANYTAGLLAATAKMFPSTMFSTGGDEINVNCYTQDGPTQQILNSTGQTLGQALSKFTQTTHGALEALGKTPVVWEEMVLDYNVTLSPKTVVMVWISSLDAAAVATAGFRMVHSPSDYFYLDCGAGGWVGDYPAGNSWCEPFKTWQKAYSFDPLANLTADQHKLVLGGQQLLWTEQSGPQNLDSIAWPRAAASAEIFWSGAGGDGDAALPRLHDIGYRFRQRGVDAIPLQPEWCALRPGVCDLTA
ncbi:N-acetylhexosaminidase [Artomyces pyxidatus]|uniref:N-acetylhexosaminidase n=1 Tax=Artomyces pyxidatus TaxID=48021 RepID=A0ACB8SW69_9AGAM|nr:N-acetylhexosaminidase [Artomyces pyxidatus]